MMSQKHYWILLCLFVCYILLGAGIFFNVETEEEMKRMEESRIERFEVEELLNQLLNKTVPVMKERALLKKLSGYCGKPISHGMKDLQIDRKWDFYHSVFFVLTVVSTIGYGNLAPTTMFSRIFMIFYGLIGIPMNGILMVTLGNYFSRSFTKLYDRWKNSRMKYNTPRFGLIGQVILYLIPGFTFFIFLPSGIMVLFEGWAYDVAVYYCFVTLTTIGFGDYVAGTENINTFSNFSFWVYKIFLLVWVIGGLGYVVMILNYITQAMQSKKMQEIEQIITENIKKTPVRIRHELRALLQEFLFLKVKPVYKGDFDNTYVPTKLERSESCPDLTVYHPTPIRKRAFSECPNKFLLMDKVQSDTELNLIDMDRTFMVQGTSPDDFMQQKQLIQQVVDALAKNLEEEGEEEQGGYHNLSDSQILASERYGSRLSLSSQTNQNLAIPASARRRAVSDVRGLGSMEKTAPNQWPSSFAPLEKSRSRSRQFSETSSDQDSTKTGSQNLFTRIKKRLLPPPRDEPFRGDVERAQHRRASMFSTPADRYVKQTARGRPSVTSLEQQEAVLEQTSIADFIRAISAITVPETMQPKQRKLGLPGPAPQLAAPRTRREAIRPQAGRRRTSLMPPEQPMPEGRRRFSLRPVEENYLAPPPPPYSALDRPITTRRFSRVNVPSISISPVVRQVNKRENKEKDGDSSTS